MIKDMITSLERTQSHSNIKLDDIHNVLKNDAAYFTIYFVIAITYMFAMLNGIGVHGYA